MLTNAEIDRVRGLREKKRRTQAGLFVIEGEKTVSELAAAGFAFEEIYATAAWTGPKSREVTDAQMAKMSHFPTPSAVLGIGRLRIPVLEAGALDQGVSLVLDGVQDPGNVGTILRIADWFGLARVVLSPDCADLHSQKVINASMGSFARVAVHTAELGAVLRGVTAEILGCDAAGEDVHRIVKPRNALVVVGSEGRGLSAAVQPLLSRKVAIPRRGRAESLNAAVAAGIVCDVLLTLP